MRALLHTEFAALLARAGVSQASFARLTGMTARQVNNWARGHALVPKWAALLAVALQDVSAEALTIALEEAAFSWREILGIPPNAGTAAARVAMTQVAGLYQPDKGGTPADDPRQRRIRERAARHASETVTDPLNVKGTNRSAQGRSTSFYSA
jgi:transcriptional regulator with XRE-family HTH domain